MYQAGLDAVTDPEYGPGLMLVRVQPGEQAKARGQNAWWQRLQDRQFWFVDLRRLVAQIEGLQR